MFDKMKSKLMGVLGITALKRDLRGANEGAAAVQKALALHELRAAGWHADATNQQRKLESTMSEIGLIVAQLGNHVFDEYTPSADSSRLSAQTFSELKEEVRRLNQLLERNQDQSSN
jgi:hypothetical protein